MIITERCSLRSSVCLQWEKMSFDLLGDHSLGLTQIEFNAQILSPVTDNRLILEGGWMWEEREHTPTPTPTLKSNHCRNSCHPSKWAPNQFIPAHRNAFWSSSVRSFQPQENVSQNCSRIIAQKNKLVLRTIEIDTFTKKLVTPRVHLRCFINRAMRCWFCKSCSALVDVDPLPLRRSSIGGKDGGRAMESARCCCVRGRDNGKGAETRRSMSSNAIGGEWRDREELPFKTPRGEKVLSISIDARFISTILLHGQKLLSSINQSFFEMLTFHAFSMNSLLDGSQLNNPRSMTSRNTRRTDFVSCLFQCFGS